MRTSKFGLRALGLAIVAALGLMAFSAVGAQAAEFKILASGALVSNEGVTGRLVTGTVSTLLVPGRSLTIRCSGLKVLSGTLISSKEGLGALEYTGCAAFNSASKEEKEELPCEIIPGKTITAKAKLLPHAANQVLAEPDLSVEEEKAKTTLPFTTVEFKSGTGCALPLKNEVKGSIVGEVSPAGESVKPKLLLTKALQEATGSEPEKGVFKGDVLLFGTFRSFIDGEGEVELTGAHIGCKFGVL